jgi:hypothetical protein
MSFHTRRRQMKKGFLSKIRLTGAAGVDEPAHKFPGWVVMKDSNNELAQAINEALESAVAQLRTERAELHDLATLVAQNQLAIDELTGLLRGRVEKSNEDVSTKAARLADDVHRIQDWMGNDVRTSITKAESMDAVEASRLFWGIS